MATVRKREGTKGVSWQIDYFDPNGKRLESVKLNLGVRTAIVRRNPRRCDQ